MSDTKPLLTVLTEALCSDFAGLRCVNEEDVASWVSGLDSEDPVNRQTLLMINYNQGWLTLLSRRVNRCLQLETPAS